MATQLEREGQPVKGPANFCHRGRIGCRQLERGADGLGPLDEEADRVVLRDGVNGNDIAHGDWQWINGQHVLATHAERCPARGQDLEGWATPKQIGNQAGNAHENVLTIIQEEEHLTRLHVEGELGGSGSVGPRRDAKRSGSGHRDERRVSDWGEVDPGNAIREVLANIAGNGQGEARLTHSTRSCHRQ